MIKCGSEEITIDSLFDANPEYSLVKKVSSDVNDDWFRYAFHLRMRHNNVKNDFFITDIHNYLCRLFMSHPAINGFIEPIFIEECEEEPYKRTHTYPYDKINKYDFEGSLIIRFNCQFRDVRELCRFFKMLYNIIHSDSMSFNLIEYEKDSDDELWRTGLISTKLLKFIFNAFHFENIYINCGRVDRYYESIYSSFFKMCLDLFSDKIHTYNRLKSVFGNTEAPLYYKNVVKADSHLVRKDDYLSQLFTTSELDDRLKNTVVDFKKLRRQEKMSVVFSVCPVLREGALRYPSAHQKITYALREILGKSSSGHIKNISVYHTGRRQSDNPKEDVYILSGCIGLFIDNDYDQTLSHLVISIRGKKDEFADNLVYVFGEEAREEINTYINYIK